MDTWSHNNHLNLNISKTKELAKDYKDSNMDIAAKKSQILKCGPAALDPAVQKTYKCTGPCMHSEAFVAFSIILPLHVCSLPQQNRLPLNHFGLTLMTSLHQYLTHCEMHLLQLVSHFLEQSCSLARTSQKELF